MNCFTQQTESLPQALRAKYDALNALLAQWPRVAVAYSGGVDSTLLLAAALEAGCEVLALTVGAPVWPRQDLQEAAAYAASRGVRHTVLEVDVFAVPQFAENPPNRCYHCKKAIFSTLLTEAAAQGFPVLVEGSNLDDAADYRPGLAAITELGVQSPLKQAGFTKEDIRTLARALAVPVWAKPAYGCLATRVPYGNAITPELLARIDAAEAVLHTYGFAQVRVRCHGGIARIEVLAHQLADLLQVREQLLAHSAFQAFDYVTVDLHGYRLGSLNAVLAPETLQAHTGAKR